jgi:hypothetical protein
MSQDGMGIESLWNFVEHWNTESNLEAGDIHYGNVRIYWSIEAENCKRTQDGLYFSSDDSKDSAVTLNLTIALP